MNNAFLWNGNTFTVSWIAANARWAVVDRKASKATDFDVPACNQSVTHGVKNGVDSKFGVVLGEVAEMCSQFVNEVRSVHGNYRSLGSYRSTIELHPQNPIFFSVLAPTWHRYHQNARSLLSSPSRG